MPHGRRRGAKTDIFNRLNGITMNCYKDVHTFHQHTQLEEEDVTMMLRLLALYAAS